MQRILVKRIVQAFNGRPMFFVCCGLILLDMLLL